METRRSGFVAVIGWTNAGKSTLVNRILGERIAVTSPRRQTTRLATNLIHTEARGQVIFMDTPGFHLPRHLLNREMLREATATLEQADCALHLLGADTPEEDDSLLDQVRRFGGPRILALNKIDLITRDELAARLGGLRHQELYADIIPVSAATGENLPRLLTLLFAHLPPGENLFPEEDLSDRNQRFFMAEIIREKVLRLTRQEVPHAVAVTVESSRWLEERGLWRIEATLHVEQESQKGILIGAGGREIKRIGTLARSEMERFLGGKVHLALSVKVRPHWTRDPQFLRLLGYRVP
jgi:GTP-binding protein Era